MKKLLTVAFILSTLVGCVTSTEIEISAEKPVDDGIPIVTTPVGNLVEISPDVANIKIDISQLDEFKVDYDLTKLSSTMGYAQVAQMMYTPDKYIGDTIKLVGQYYTQTVSGTDIVMNVILLMDEEQCCQGYLEFMLPAGVEYPQMGQEIGLVGTYVMTSDATGDFPIIDVTDYII